MKGAEQGQREGAGDETKEPSKQGTVAHPPTLEEACPRRRTQPCCWPHRSKPHARPLLNQIALPNLVCRSRIASIAFGYDIDELVEADHPVRAVWSYVLELDITPLYDRIRARAALLGDPPSIHVCGRLVVACHSLRLHQRSRTQRPVHPSRRLPLARGRSLRPTTTLCPIAAPTTPSSWSNYSNTPWKCCVSKSDRSGSRRSGWHACSRQCRSSVVSSPPDLGRTLAEAQARFNACGRNWRQPPSILLLHKRARWRRPWQFAGGGSNCHGSRCSTRGCDRADASQFAGAGVGQSTGAVAQQQAAAMRHAEEHLERVEQHWSGCPNWKRDQAKREEGASVSTTDHRRQ